MATLSRTESSSGARLKKDRGKATLLFRCLSDRFDEVDGIPETRSVPVKGSGAPVAAPAVCGDSFAPGTASRSAEPHPARIEPRPMPLAVASPLPRS